MQVAPIQRQSAAAACATALRRAILSGELRVGQRLPPERTLAADFGVNRLTLRAALAQLLALGLISVRQGSGYTVADVARVGSLDLLPDVLHMAAEDRALLPLVTDLLAVRRALASTILERLAATSEPAAIDSIAAAVDDFEAQCQSTAISVVALVEADFAIVAAMVDAIHSPIIRMCINPVILAVAQIRELADAMYVDPRSNLAGHRALLQWLRDPTVAPLSAVIDALESRDAVTIERMQRAMENV